MLSDCGRQPCLGLIHKPDVRSVCQMWLMLLCFAPLVKSKWSTMTGFTGEDLISPLAIGQFKKKQGERSIIMVLKIIQKSLYRSGEKVSLSYNCATKPFITFSDPL